MILGLNGTERTSTYAIDVLNALPKDVLVITVRGREMCDEDERQKFYVKNDVSRVFYAYTLAKAINSSAPVIGLGFSLGGALLLQAQSKYHCFRRVIVVSTSIWYKHALETMPSSSWWGWLANKILVWYQFKNLFWRPNFLHHMEHKLTIYEWLRLFFASSMLDQDKILCSKYGMDYESYINSLDLRQSIRASSNVHYLVSSNDPLFSPEHIEETKKALENTSVDMHVTDFGTHVDFSKQSRNDYLISFILHCIEETPQEEDLLCDI